MTACLALLLQPEMGSIQNNKIGERVRRGGGGESEGVEYVQKVNENQSHLCSMHTEIADLMLTQSTTIQSQKSCFCNLSGSAKSSRESGRTYNRLKESVRLV